MAHAGPFTPISAKCYALYLGEARRNLSSIRVALYIHGVAAVAGGGGAALNWAEIGIATGTLEDNAGKASTTLTVKGYASIDTEARTAATAVVEKNITGISIAEGEGMWQVFASTYETLPMNLRYIGAAGNISGEYRAKTTTQPSLIVGVPTAFVDDAGGTAIPWFRALDLDP